MSFIIKKLVEWRNILKKYLRVSQVNGISRRYFVINSFDGVMTSLGIIFASYVTGVHEPKFVLAAGVGASLAMFFSGFTGVYLTEKAERIKKIKELEHDLLKSLDKSIHKKAMEVACIWSAMVDGVSPLVSSVTSLLPFFLTLLGTLTINIAYYLSITIAFFLIFFLGMFLGKISKENLILSGFKMLLAGVMVALISTLLAYL